MVTTTEAMNAKPPLGAALAAGVKVLSADQTLIFQLYQKYVFPLDGMVYWFKVTGGQTAEVVPYPSLTTVVSESGESVLICPGGIAANQIISGRIDNPLAASDQGIATDESLFVDLTGPATLHASPTTSEIRPGETFEIPCPPNNGVWVNAKTSWHKFSVNLWTYLHGTGLPATVAVEGSLHYASNVEQKEDLTVHTNEVIFTSLSEIQPFNQLGPNYLYACQYQDILFAFSARGRLYEQADLYHYTGQALYSVNRTQIINDPSQFNPTLIVSNSLPIWLAMVGYIPPYYTGLRCPFPLYPSYLVEDNLTPPFGAVHIENTKALQAAPFLGPRMSQSQLARETVRVTLYGVNNLDAETFLAFVDQYSMDEAEIGLSNMPIVVDEKRPQSEFRILSQKKIIEFVVNYNQSAARNLARQLIEHVKVTYFDPVDAVIIPQ